MKVTVKFFAGLRELFGMDETRVELENASDVQTLLNILCNSDESRQKILDESGGLRQNIILLKNGRHITYLDGIKTKLEDGDEIAMFPPVGGG